MEAEIVAEAPKPVVPGLSEQELSLVESISALEELGLDCLKQSLADRGLKCGGTLKERASRLFSVRNLSPEAYPAKLRAAKAKHTK